MKIKLIESHNSFREFVKQYASMYRDNELARINKVNDINSNHWLETNASKINPEIRDSIEKKVSSWIKNTNEASTSSSVGSVSTPFAFSRKGSGNVDAATQLDFKLVKPILKSKDDMTLENYIPKDLSINSFNVGVENTFKKISKIVEGLNGLRFQVDEVDEQLPAQPAQSVQPASQASNIQIQTYNLQPDFTEFDSQLKNCTEELKIKLQKNIQSKILDKKIVVRASKGFKQPETDYTVNVTGVHIDYYYDRYVIIIIGREESKQKTAKFFVKPGFKIKILGAADIKQKDKYQIAKSKVLVDPNKQSTINPSNTVTSDEPIPAKQAVPPTV